MKKNSQRKLAIYEILKECDIQNKTKQKAKKMKRKQFCDFFKVRRLLLKRRL